MNGARSANARERGKWGWDRGGGRLGAEGFAYPAIVASGTNGLTLHYTRNSGAVSRSELLLVDAGASFHGYASDVTRTWPPSGRFSGAQREVYDTVLRVQVWGGRVRVGVPAERVRGRARVCDRAEAVH